MYDLTVLSSDVARQLCEADRYVFQFNSTKRKKLGGIT